MKHPHTDSRFEILPWERGVIYVVKHSFTVVHPRNGRRKTVQKGYRHDGATIAPDGADLAPFALHDNCYDTQVWDDGEPMSRADADYLMRWAMQTSGNSYTRMLADHYHKYVRRYGWISWWKVKIGKALRRIF